jgi:endonuclease-3 related protein
MGLLDGDEGYETIRERVERALGPDSVRLNEYHALIVRHAKDLCRARKPQCGGCSLRPDCLMREEG